MAVNVRFSFFLCASVAKSLGTDAVSAHIRLQHFGNDDRCVFLLANSPPARARLRPTGSPDPFNVCT
jgi:hypothetical protein